MAKKGEEPKEEAPDFRKGFMQRMELEILKSRLDAMGEFQNRIVEIVDKAHLPPQELYFVLCRVADNVMENFNKAILYKEAPKEESKEE